MIGAILGDIIGSPYEFDRAVETNTVWGIGFKLREDDL